MLGIGRYAQRWTSKEEKPAVWRDGRVQDYGSGFWASPPRFFNVQKPMTELKNTGKNSAEYLVTSPRHRRPGRGVYRDSNSGRIFSSPNLGSFLAFDSVSLKTPKKRY